MRVRGPRSLSQAVRWLLNTGRTGAPSFSYGGGGRTPRSKLAQNVVEGNILNGRMVREGEALHVVWPGGV